MHIAGGIILIPKTDDIPIKEKILKTENKGGKNHLSDLLMSW